MSEEGVAMIVSKEVASGRATRRKQHSDDPQTDEKITCPVCKEAYFESEENEQNIEVPLATPCGHIVGHRCFEKWRLTCERNRQPVSCPLCRFCLHFGCGHIASPLFAFSHKIPPKIQQEEAPDKCFNCYIEWSQYDEEIELLEDSYRTLAPSKTRDLANFRS